MTTYKPHSLPNACKGLLSCPWVVGAIIWGAVLASLGLALLAEYGFGLLPCELCLLQRIPSYCIAGFGLLLFVPFTKRHSFWILAAFGLLLLVNMGIGSYHTGVEQQWWPGPTSCSSASDTTSFGDIEALRAHILDAPLIRCDKPALEVMGLTMASANALFCAMLAMFACSSLVVSSSNKRKCHA